MLLFSWTWWLTLNTTPDYMDANMGYALLSLEFRTSRLFFRVSKDAANHSFWATWIPSINYPFFFPYRFWSASKYWLALVQFLTTVVKITAVDWGHELCPDQNESIWTSLLLNLYKPSLRLLKQEVSRCASIFSITTRGSPITKIAPMANWMYSSLLILF